MGGLGIIIQTIQKQDFIFFILKQDGDTNNKDKKKKKRIFKKYYTLYSVTCYILI